MEESINLRNYLGQHVLVTYRDGRQAAGTIRISDSRIYPIALEATDREESNPLTYTEHGQVLMFNENDEDITSIEPFASENKMKNNVHLPDYLNQRVCVTYRNGLWQEGVIIDNGSGEFYQYTFRYCGGYETYTADGRAFMDRYDEADIISIETLNPVGKDGRHSAIEKMALSLLPAVFTSLESDPNLDEAIDRAIRGVFLAMFGGDVSGGTLDLSVSVIKSRITLSLKQ